MDQVAANVFILIIAGLIILYDVLKNIRIFVTKRIIITGILAYLSLFLLCYLIVYQPEKHLLLFITFVLGLIPSRYFWKLRDSKVKKRMNAIIIFVLIVAAGINYLIHYFNS